MDTSKDWLGPVGYFDSPVFSDVTINFGSHTVGAYKMVLATASGIFKAAFKGQSAVVTLPSLSRMIEVEAVDRERSPSTLRYMTMILRR